jgi:hypothetical protein
MFSYIHVFPLGLYKTKKKLLTVLDHSNLRFFLLNKFNYNMFLSLLICKRRCAIVLSIHVIIIHQLEYIHLY